MIRLAVNGACGRMAMRVVQLALEDDAFSVEAALERPGHPSLGKDIGVLAGREPIGVALSSVLTGRPDVLVDFSEPSSSLERAREAAGRGAALLIGTTGFNEDQKKQLQALAATTAVLISPNMSVGVNLLFSLVGKVAQVLGDQYDIEIIEIHHRFKKDAPSGTALRLAEKIAEATGRDLARDGVYGRRGITGERKRSEIGIHAVRAGDAVGEHRVLFSCLGETVELIHHASARDAFARGALRAAKFLAGKPPGIYSAAQALGVE